MKALQTQAQTNGPTADAAALMWHLMRDHDHVVSDDPGARGLFVLEVVHENLHAVADADPLRDFLGA